MDNVLFYGERDEQTRRQVRSAAAAHSHRIGPRKPKAVGKPINSSSSSSKSEVPLKRRTVQQKSSNTTSVKQEPGPAGSAVSSPQTVVDWHKPYRPTPCRSSTTYLGTDEQQPHGRPHVDPVPSRVHATAGLGQRSMQLHPHAAMKSASEPSPAATTSTTASPASESRTSTASPAASINSQDSLQRLPQYSWTEYPRFGLGSNRVHSLETLADVASPAPGASGSMSPAEQGIPGLRHFERTAQGRPILPPLARATTSPYPPNRVGVGEGRQDSVEVQVMDAEPQLRHATRDPRIEFVHQIRPPAASNLYLPG